MYSNPLVQASFFFCRKGLCHIYISGVSIGCRSICRSRISDGIRIVPCSSHSVYVNSCSHFEVKGFGVSRDSLWLCLYFLRKIVPTFIYVLLFSCVSTILSIVSSILLIYFCTIPPSNQTPSLLESKYEHPLMSI